MFKWVSTLKNTCYFLILPEWDDFPIWLHIVTKTHAEANCYVNLPSCDDTVHVVYKVAFVHSPCYKYENSQPYWGDDYLLRLVFCYNSIFKCVYKVCYESSFSPPRKRTIILYMTGGQPSCSFETPQLPPQGKGWNEPWETICFTKKLPTCPNLEQ